MPFSSTKKGHVLLWKGTFYLEKGHFHLEKGHFLGVGNWGGGGKCPPPPPVPPPLCTTQNITSYTMIKADDGEEYCIYNISFASILDSYTKLTKCEWNNGVFFLLFIVLRYFVSERNCKTHFPQAKFDMIYANRFIINMKEAETNQSKWSTPLPGKRYWRNKINYDRHIKGTYQYQFTHDKMVLYGDILSHLWHPFGKKSSEQKLQRI